jgi:hypothetical protein
MTPIAVVNSARLIVALGAAIGGAASGQCQPIGYSGRPFEDTVYHDGAQKIPGRVECAYYDFGGEGVAYHTEDTKNKGSGSFNKADGTYLNEFRMNEAVSISYTKFGHSTQIDDNPFNLVVPPKNQLYVGWTKPGEWFNMTVEVKEAGEYAIDLLYTSHQGGNIELEWNGKPLAGPVAVQSTFNAADPIKWRDWHHWNLMRSIATVSLPQGVSVLTLKLITEGNFNLAYLDFHPVSRP